MQHPRHYDTAKRRRRRPSPFSYYPKQSQSCDYEHVSNTYRALVVVASMTNHPTRIDRRTRSISFEFQNDYLH